MIAAVAIGQYRRLLVRADFRCRRTSPTLVDALELDLAAMRLANTQTMHTLHSNAQLPATR